jgi:hypothetical protein
MNVIIRNNTAPATQSWLNLRTWWSVEAVDAEGRTHAFATLPDEASALAVAASYRSRFA